MKKMLFIYNPNSGMGLLKTEALRCAGYFCKGADMR